MKFSASGLGYRASLVDQGIEIGVDRLIESRGEVSGELLVSRTGEGHLMQARFNLSSITARNSTAKYLGERSNSVDWNGVLERFSLEVIRRERTASPVVALGRRPPRPAPNWQLWPLLVKGDPTILYGDGEAGKSTLAGAAAVAWTTGAQVIPGWKAHGTGNVLVLDWEADEEDWTDIIGGIGAGCGHESPEGSIWYRYCSTSLPAMLHEVAAQITEHDISLVIIDSVGMATPGEREGASAESGTLRLFSAIRRLGVATLLIDHLAKSDLRNGQIAPGPYGSIYKRYRTRLAFELRAADTRAGDDWKHTAMYHRKGNKIRRMDAMGIGILHDTDGTIRFRAEEVRDALEAGMSHGERITRFLLDEGKATIREIAEATGIDSKIVHVTVSRSGHLMKVGLDGKAAMWGVRTDGVSPTSPTRVGDGKSNKGSPLKGGEPLVLDVVGVGDEEPDQRSFRDVLAEANEDRADEGDWDID